MDEAVQFWQTLVVTKMSVGKARGECMKRQRDWE